MVEWVYRWELLDVAVLCIALGLAVRYWRRVSDRRRKAGDRQLDRLRGLGT